MMRVRQGKKTYADTLQANKSRLYKNNKLKCNRGRKTVIRYRKDKKGRRRVEIIIVTNITKRESNGNLQQAKNYVYIYYKCKYNRESKNKSFTARK